MIRFLKIRTNFRTWIEIQKCEVVAKIYTKKGDHGITSLLGGTRKLKSDIRIESYGNVDELNSFIGLLRDQSQLVPKKEFIIKIQNNLFVIGSHLANDPEQSRFELPELKDEWIKDIESEIDDMDKMLPKMTHFVLPGGHSAVSIGHVCRTVCRRAERNVVLLAQNESVNEYIIRYLNRLSDYLFVLCRWITHAHKIEEIKWVP